MATSVLCQEVRTPPRIYSNKPANVTGATSISICAPRAALRSQPCAVSWRQETAPPNVIYNYCGRALYWIYSWWREGAGAPSNSAPSPSRQVSDRPAMERRSFLLPHRSDERAPCFQDIDLHAQPFLTKRGRASKQVVKRVFVILDGKPLARWRFSDQQETLTKPLRSPQATCSTSMTQARPSRAASSRSPTPSTSRTRTRPRTRPTTTATSCARPRAHGVSQMRDIATVCKTTH